MCNLFACFPWNFLVYGQYDANLLSFALVPSFLYVVLCVLDSQSERLPVLGSVAMLVVAGFCLARPMRCLPLAFFASLFCFSSLGGRQFAMGSFVGCLHLSLYALR